MGNRRWLTPLVLVGAVASAAFASGYAVAEMPDGSLSPTTLQRQVVSWFLQLRHSPTESSEIGDGKAWREIVLHDPIGIDRGPGGDLYVSDRGRDGLGARVWRLRPGGPAEVIAGTGIRGVSATGIDARKSHLGEPQGLAVDADGRVYFADSYNHVVLRIEGDGTLTKVAGNGRRGYEGDGGPATEARLDRPFDVRLGPEGQLCIAEQGNHVIRMVTPDGTIRTVAGNGEPGYSGDGGPATEARLRGPYGCYPTRDGGLLIADSDNHVVRRVDESGLITTIAGIGRPSYSGDGGPASAAGLSKPEIVVMDGEGRIYIGDEHNHAVRVIDTAGTMTTLMGTGKPGTTEEGRPVARAPLDDPENVLILRDGSVLVAEGDAGRILRITPAGVVGVVAGAIAGGSSGV